MFSEVLNSYLADSIALGRDEASCHGNETCVRGADNFRIACKLRDREHKEEGWVEEASILCSYSTQEIMLSDTIIESVYLFSAALRNGHQEVG